MRDDYIIEITDPHYTAGMAGGVAVPVPDGAAFTLWTVEGDRVAAVRRHEVGRYVIDGDDDLRLYRDEGTPGDGPVLYREWADALADATGGRLTAGEIAQLPVL
jgi:hypothetical protein